MHDENGVLELILPDGSNVPWGVAYSNTEKLLVREEYKRLYNEIKDRPNLKMAHLTGTSGIGKTIFLFWLIYKLVSSRAKGSPIPSILLVVGGSKTQYLLRYNDDKPEVMYWSGQQRVDYVLSDVSYNVNVQPIHWNLQISAYGAITKPTEYIDALHLLGGHGLQMVRQQQLLH